MQVDARASFLSLGSIKSLTVSFLACFATEKYVWSSRALARLDVTKALKALEHLRESSQAVDALAW